MSHHPAKSYHTLHELLSAVLGPDYSKGDKFYRFWVQKWNAWRTKHPGLPYQIKCAVCSGEEAKLDRKHGKWKESKPRREDRDLED